MSLNDSQRIDGYDRRMRRSLPVLCCFLMALAAALIAPAVHPDDNDNGWRLEKDKDGVQIYTRPVEGWSIREIRGRTRIPARLSAVVAVLTDVAATRELNDVVDEAKIQQRDSDQRYLVYNAMKMPVVKNREILNQREITQDPGTLAVTITDIAVPGIIPPRDGYVRMVKSHQQWILTPTPDGQVAVEMQALTDPAGSIPSWMINSMSVDKPFKSLNKLKEMSLRDQYAHASLSYIKEPAGKEPAGSHS